MRTVPRADSHSVMPGGVMEGPKMPLPLQLFQPYKSLRHSSLLSPPLKSCFSPLLFLSPLYSSTLIIPITPFVLCWNGSIPSLTHSFAKYIGLASYGLRSQLTHSCSQGKLTEDEKISNQHLQQFLFPTKNHTSEVASFLFKLIVTSFCLYAFPGLLRLWVPDSLSSPSQSPFNMLHVVVSRNVTGHLTRLSPFLSYKMSETVTPM